MSPPTGPFTIPRVDAVYILTIQFRYQERSVSTGSILSTRTPADSGDNQDIVRGGDIVGLTGGAKILVINNRRVIWLPARGGVTCHVNPTLRVLDPTRQLWVVAEGGLSPTGVVRTVSYSDANVVPDTRVGLSPRQPQSSTYWRSYVKTYLDSAAAERDKVLAFGDLLIRPTQLNLDQLNAAYPSLSSPTVVTLLSTSASSTDYRRRAQVELASLLLNVTSGVVHPDDLAKAYGATRTISDIAKVSASLIAAGSSYSTVFNTLYSINSRSIPVYKNL
jgi:hypothetical protein